MKEDVQEVVALLEELCYYGDSPPARMKEVVWEDLLEEAPSNIPPGAPST
jgi:hypothetical protein